MARGWADRILRGSRPSLTLPIRVLPSAWPLVAVFLAATSASAQTYAVSWWTVDGGGAATSTGGTYSLGGTIGQPDAGILSGGAYSLSGGFWGGAGLGSGVFEADLSLGIADSPDPVTGLGAVAYTIAVSSAAGFSQANNLSLTQSFVSIPSSVSFVSATGSGWSCSAGTSSVTCTRPSLASGSSAPSLTVQWTVGPAGGTLSASATVTASEADPYPADNMATATTMVNGVPYADLAVSQTDGGVTILWNHPLSYLITVSNAGPNAVSGATVTDTFSGSLASVAWTCAASPGSSCTPSGSGNIADSSVNLLSGGTATYTATGLVLYGTAGPIPNTVTVSAPTPTYDPIPGNNSSTIQTPVNTDLIFKDGFQ